MLAERVPPAQIPEAGWRPHEGVEQFVTDLLVLTALQARFPPVSPQLKFHERTSTVVSNHLRWDLHARLITHDALLKRDDSGVG